MICFTCLTVEDGEALDPCILSTLRKLQDGYFAGARSVSILLLLYRCPVVLYGNSMCCFFTAGCRCQTSPVSKPLRSTLASASWMKRMMTAYWRKTRMTRTMKSTERTIITVVPQVGSDCVFLSLLPE